MACLRQRRQGLSDRHGGLTSRKRTGYFGSVTECKAFGMFAELSWPWKMSMPLYRRQEPNVQLLEYACYEDLTLEKFFPGKR